MYAHIYIYIYTHVYNPHLGLINAPPPYLFFPPNDLFHYSFTINKTKHIHNYGQVLCITNPQCTKYTKCYIYIYIHNLVFMCMYVYISLSQSIYIYIHTYICIYTHRRRGRRAPPRAPRSRREPWYCNCNNSNNDDNSTNVNKWWAYQQWYKYYYYYYH